MTFLPYAKDDVSRYHQFARQRIAQEFNVTYASVRWSQCHCQSTHAISVINGSVAYIQQ